MVFWAKIQKNFLTQGLISLTKYWNSVTVGSPAKYIKPVKEEFTKKSQYMYYGDED